jgi:hypothetical protein
MARAAVKYVFAALLALLSTQAGAPSVRVVAGIEIVWCAEAELPAPRDARRFLPEMQVRQPASAYVSRTKAQPDAAFLFQRPPPTASLFS